MCMHITLRGKLASGRQLGVKAGTVFPENSTGKIFMIQRVVSWDMILKCIPEGIREKTISLDLARAHTHNIIRTPVNEQGSIREKWELNSGSLEEEYFFLTAEPPL